MGKCYQNLDNRTEAENCFLKSLQLDSSQIPVFQDFLSVRESNLDDLSKIVDGLSFDRNTEWLKDYYKLCHTKESLDMFFYLDKISFVAPSQVEQENRDFKGEVSNLHIERKLKINKDGGSNILMENKTENDQNEYTHRNPETKTKYFGNEESYKSEKDVNNNQIKVEDPFYENCRQRENRKIDPVITSLIKQNNTELLYLKAESLYKNYELSEAYKVCKRILTLDSFHFKTLLIYAELLVERKVCLYHYFLSLNMFI